jgi:hypothetical protein
MEREDRAIDRTAAAKIRAEAPPTGKTPTGKIGEGSRDAERGPSLPPTVAEIAARSVRDTNLVGG